MGKRLEPSDTRQLRGPRLFKYNLDITGEKYGEWTVISRLHNSRWLCRCVCGNESSVPVGDLRSGRSRGCRPCRCIAGLYNRTHGKKNTRLHRIWTGMKQRCRNEKFPAYVDYGGRGIDVCPEWAESFEAFYTWAL